MTPAPIAGRPKPPRKRGSFGSNDMRLLLFGIGGGFVLGGGEEFGQGLSFTVGVLPRDIDLHETERLGQPARPIKQPLGLPGHVAFLEVVDELHRLLALGLAHLRPALPQRRTLQVSPCQPELDWPGIHELALLSVL